jgi:hypothetical protein
MDKPGFDLGFGLSSGDDLPSNIGTWSIEYVKKTGEEGERNRDSTKVKIDKCDEKSATW